MFFFYTGLYWNKQRWYFTLLLPSAWWKKQFEFVSGLQLLTTGRSRPSWRCARVCWKKVKL